jgi:hypothetical protein
MYSMLGEKKINYINGGGELAQIILYASMELWYPLPLLIFANINI